MTNTTLCRSLTQKHRHRSEHWIVVDRTATVIKENEKYTVHANESTYIPTKKIHHNLKQHPFSQEAPML